MKVTSLTGYTDLLGIMGIIFGTVIIAWIR